MAKPTKKQKALAIKLGDNQKLYTVEEAISTQGKAHGIAY